jgi:hypothetical protein
MKFIVFLDVSPSNFVGQTKSYGNLNANVAHYTASHSARQQPTVDTYLREEDRALSGL